ncbi:MAG: AAA family ATPase [Candidatus Rokubacteria bacterium]|nr:AAA family ATPase [Candidatus Rokubacteria bacterium]
MACSACGAATRPGAKFCEECGARLDTVCPACGARLSPGKKFCGDCGARLAGGVGAAADPPPAPRDAGLGSEDDRRRAAPSGYTPQHLAERILKDRTALQGERKQVTVLFADVSGFTSLAERLDPEEVHTLMNRAFELMLASVHRYEGTVNQFLGDGLMALFGAPVAHEDHARRAALAALGMQRALGAYREELKGRRGVDFRVRLGLNTGLVVVAAIGDNLRMDYTAVGDTTNVAARMQQMAEPGQVVLADTTRRLIEPYFHLTSLGTVVLKNRAEPVAAWALGEPRSVAESRPLTPLLGRREALGTLARAWSAARAGRGQVVSLVGEAGIGKSRLLLELRRQAGGAATWLEGRCLSFGQSTAMLPIADCLRQGFAVSEADSESAIIEKVTRGLKALGEPPGELAPYLRYALSVDPGDPAIAAMDPVERRARIFRAISQLTRRSSQRRPVVLVVEDLQWIDSASEDYLAELINGIAGEAILLVLTWRPSYRPRFPEHTYITRLVLEPLEDADAHRLVRATLGIGDLPDELAAIIARKAEGNPFFLEEIGRALVESGAVHPEGGRLTLACPASAIVVPDRVQDLIAARIDRLGEEQKRTVQIASVIGREFALRLLRRVAEATDRVERALGDLKALEFVYEKMGAADLEYVFKHVLTQDVAYESILLARRRDLHARIGATIEELHADRVEEHVEELAHHFVRGEVWPKAARYARQAGDRAAALCTDARAVEFYEQALEALGRLPESPETGRLGVDVRLALRAPLWRAGQLDRLFEIFKEAEGLATRHGETDRLDVVYSFFTQYHWAKGEQREAIAYGRRGLETAERRGDLGLLVTGHYYIGCAHLAVGQYPLALEHFSRVIERLEGPRATERFGLSGLPYCGSCALGALCLLAMGDPERALALIERGERVVQAARHLYSEVPLMIARGRLLTERGRAGEALGVLEGAVAICRERKFAGQLMRALGAASSAYSLTGRHQEAIAAARECVELQEKAAALVERGDHVRHVAEAQLHAGELDLAEASAREAIAFAHRLAERSAEARALWILGEVCRHRGDRDSAARHYEQARDLAEELGMRPLAKRCRESLAALG